MVRCIREHGDWPDRGKACIRGPSVSRAADPCSPVLAWLLPGNRLSSTPPPPPPKQTPELLITNLTAPRRHTTNTTSHSSTTASPPQPRRCSRRETPLCSTAKHQLDPGTSPADLKETQRRRPGTNRTRDTNTTTLISLEQILHAAFPPETLRRTAHHDFSQTPRQYRQSVFHSPPAGRHLVRRKCEPVAAQLRPVRGEKDG